MSDVEETARVARDVLHALETVKEDEQPILLFGIALELLEEVTRTPELEHELERVILRVQMRLGVWKGEDELEERARKKGRKRNDD